MHYYALLCIIMHYHTLPVGGISLNVSPGNWILLPSEMQGVKSELKKVENRM